MNLKKGLDETVYDLFIDGFYSCAYQAGQKVDPAELAEKYQISRTPVIQALKRLNNEKILMVTNGGKYYIPVPTRQLLREICEVRYLFEKYAVLYHIESGSTQVKHELYEKALQCKMVMSNGNERESVKADLDFHRSLVESTANTCLYEAYMPILNRFISIKYVMGKQYETQRSANERHIRLMQDIMDKKAETACETLYDHIFLAMKRMAEEMGPEE